MTSLSAFDANDVEDSLRGFEDILDQIDLPGVENTVCNISGDPKFDAFEEAVRVCLGPILMFVVPAHFPPHLILVKLSDRSTSWLVPCREQLSEVPRQQNDANEFVYSWIHKLATAIYTRSTWEEHYDDYPKLGTFPFGDAELPKLCIPGDQDCLSHGLAFVLDSTFDRSGRLKLAAALFLIKHLRWAKANLAEDPFELALNLVSEKRSTESAINIYLAAFNLVAEIFVEGPRGEKRGSCSTDIKSTHVLTSFLTHAALYAVAESVKSQYPRSLVKLVFKQGHNPLSNHYDLFLEGNRTLFSSARIDLAQALVAQGWPPNFLPKPDLLRRCPSSVTRKNKI